MSFSSYTVTDYDKRVMEYDFLYNKTLKFLRNRDQYKFNIGDFLIREDNVGGNKWEVHTAKCGLPYRYVYLFENELGIGYVRRLSVRKEELVDSPICILNFDLDVTRFKLDPSYADSILLGEKFNPVDDYKTARQKLLQVKKANDKIAIRTKNETEADSFAKSLHVGQTLWFQSPYGDDIDKGGVTVVHTAQQHVDYYLCLNTKALVLKFNNTGETTTIPYTDMSGYKWWTTRPRFADEEL